MGDLSMDKKEIEELQKLMTYNENGEGVINGKTIRELEFENMQTLAKEYEDRAINFMRKSKRKNYPICNWLHNSWIKYEQFSINNFEIVIGLIISISFIFVYFISKTDDPNTNASLISGLLGGLGAIIAIILTISFTKRSNEQTLDASVLPYIIIKKGKEAPTEYLAYEYISSEENIFDGVWRPFDFNTIKDDKRTLVRNGIAYLRLENIGLGPAKKIKISINDFGKIYLDKDYIQENETINIILNFNNPDKDYRTSLNIEYETLRNVQHTQKFAANITWHLDRTNFTLFS
jgi:hypothetical protein